MRPASFIGRIDNLLLDGQPWRRGLSSGKIPSVPERLRRNEVHVRYRFTEGLDADAVDRAVAVLSADERQRYARFRFERDRHDYAAAHALLRESLSRHVAVASASWRFERTLDGKPVLAQDHGFGLAFNLSHTLGAIVCASTGGNDVGVDVESTTRRVDDDVARAVCSKVSCVGATQRRDKLSSKHTTEYLHGQKPACLGRVQR